MAAQAGAGLLAVWTDVDPTVEAEFNEWYFTEHIPERMAVPGFLGGRRYLAVDGQPKYLALYELDDENVLKTGAYLKLIQAPTPWTKRMTGYFRNMSRCVYRQIFAHGNRPDHDAEYVLSVRLNIPSEHESEFNEWYNVDHVPALVSVPGVYCAQRYVAVEGDPKYLAIYEMKEAGVPKSDEWERARNSDWTKRMRPNLRDGRVVTSQLMKR